MDYASLRKRMVEEQLALRGIKNQRVLEAFHKVERHKFIPLELRDSAYLDFPLAIGKGQTISQPYIVALMTECLELEGKEKVLEIGTGSGYQAAILAELAAQVYSIERFERLAESAKETLGAMGYTNIQIKTGDGTLGWPQEAPFDRIIITAASPSIPPPLVEQLKDGGRMILPLGEALSQTLILARKKNGELESRAICGCVFVPLVGQYGYKNDTGIHG